MSQIFLILGHHLTLWIRKDRFCLQCLAIATILALACISSWGIDNPAGMGNFSLFTPAFSGIGTNKMAGVAKRFPGGIFGAQNAIAAHLANPAAKVYRYQLGPYVQIKHVPKSLVPTSHPFYAEAGTDKTIIADTALIRQGPSDPQPDMINWPRQFPPYPVVVPNNPAWLAFLDATLPKLIEHYDGLFLDSMGTTPVVTRYLVAKPINPQTRQPYTMAEWFAAEAVMVNHVKKMLKPGQVLLVQGLVDGETFFGPNSIRPLLVNCDGAMAEMIYRGPQHAADKYPSPDKWLKDVRMIAEVEAMGKSGFYWTKNWVPLTEAQRTQWLRYALCSFLLGAGTRSHFNFDSHNEPVSKGRGNNADPVEIYPAYDQARELGNAVDATMSPVDSTGAYFRRWQHGRVYVNPTQAAVEITLDGKFADLDGHLLGNAIMLPAHSGQIYLKQP